MIELLKSKKINWQDCHIGLDGRIKTDKSLRLCKYVDMYMDSFNAFSGVLQIHANNIRKRKLFDAEVNFNDHSKIRILKYEKGGMFKAHHDHKTDENHIGTLVLLAPKSLSNYEGGDLIINKKIRVAQSDERKETNRDYENNEEIIEITSDEEYWISVGFPLETQHEVTKVTKGVRISITIPIIVTNKCGNYDSGEDEYEIDTIKVPYIRNLTPRPVNNYHYSGLVDTYTYDYDYDYDYKGLSDSSSSDDRAQGLSQAADLFASDEESDDSSSSEEEV
jgi:hypothetical protein